MMPRNPDGRWARRRQEGDETTTSRRPHTRPTRSTRQAPQRIEINSDDDDEVQFQSSRRIRGIENGLLVNRLQQPPPAPPIQPPARQLPTRVFSIADGLRFLSDSMPSRSGLEGIDARIRQRYQQLDIPLHTIGFGGVFHPQFVQQPKKHYSVKASHPKKWPGFSSNAGPNIRHRKLIDSGKSSRQLVINGEGDRALYALRCGHLIDGRTYKELVESNILPKKRKTSKTKQDSKVKQLDKKEALQIQKNKKPIDLREEYFRLQSKEGDLDNWENKRIRDEYPERSFSLSTQTTTLTMSPIQPGGKQKESGTARVLGSGTSGIAELMVFHPIDTIAKRLMTNSGHANAGNLKDIIFKQHANSPALTKALSLFPGLGYAAGYKVAQRVYKFGGQPYFNDILNTNYGSYFKSFFGEKNGKAIMSASAGSLTGIGEVVLLPLDVLKIKRQTNPESFKGRGIVKIVADEGFGLYRGWGWTMARNAPGSFALFGGSALTKGYIFGLEDYSKATFYQNFFASIGGAVSSITVAAPLDVVKTRIQQANFETNTSGVTVIKDIIKNEGPSAFFKGLTPKILVVGPKLVFSYTLAQTLIPMFGKYF
ncbi:hypothetical protein E3Q16_01717 [Wallemia mellicola]|uniref:Cytochrome c oxidase assembly protein COX16, mitochondrial n=2 Tax=Wallemia mellicola TaxID=1708541 RepID=A0AB74KE27_9BASI|nr:hypothetical protein E3Q16_01717 [Wallemia mellicola]TIC66817.1 hypothetical protein E3Q03_02114 [Wallemia mellicola]